jgi:TonB family protein
MPDTNTPTLPPVDPHITHVRPDRPVDVHFSFEQSQSRVGVAASVASHIAMGLIAFLVMRYAPEAQSLEPPAPTLPNDIVWLSEPGPGGGGGGGGNKMPDPPKKAELPGKEKITVPVEKKPDPRPEPPKEEPKPAEDLVIPAKTMAAADQALPGAIATEAPVTVSQGSGTGGGSGTGTGSGVGPGQGSGLGPGTGGGTGGGAYRPGAGIVLPEVLKEVKPAYTADAMRAKVQGVVWLECIVMPDGTVGDVKITKSLDSVFGLDHEAIKAARQWRFKPGMRQGQPVPVIITIELTFTLR